MDLDKIEWSKFISLPTEEQAEITNKVMESNSKMTLGDISEEVFNQQKHTLSKHFRKLGYAFKNRKYVKDDEKGNKKMTEVKESNAENTKVNKSNQMNTLKMYGVINEVLVDLDTKETERATVKMAKDTAEKLDEFLKQHKILNKQDVISVAIERFLQEFSK